MIEAIAHMRQIADETEATAKGADKLLRAELIDLAVKWRWLAGEAAKLCGKAEELGPGHPDCGHCAEQCLSRGAR